MTMIQSATSVAYNYDTKENLDKVQPTEAAAAEAAVVVETVEEKSQVKPMDTAEAIEMSILEAADYTKKIKEKIVASEIIDQDPYMDMAIELKKTIDKLLSSVTEEDVKHVIKEHFNPEKISIDIFEKVIDQNKMAIRINDIPKIEKDVELQVKEFRDRFTDEKLLKKVIASLKEHNLPINDKNIEKIVQVVQKAEEIKTIPNEAIVNVIKQNKALTVENVYKAKFMSGQPVKEDDSLVALETQIKKLLKEEELPATKDLIELSKLLIKSDVPLDPTTFEKVKVLKNDLKEIDTAYVIDRAAENLMKKIPIAEIPIVEASTIAQAESNELPRKDKIEKIIQQIPKIEIRHIEQVVRSRQEINLDQIFKVMTTKTMSETSTIEQTGVSTTNTPPLDASQDLKIIKANLNIAEIQLKMTLEAATRLSDKGINIEIEPLEELVSQLRTLERESYAKQLEQNNVPVTQDKINQIQEVYEQVNQLRTISPKSIVKVITQEIDFTIKAVSDESRRELLRVSATKNYEMLSTKPRGDLGDSIEKTFVHMAATLEEIGVDPTENALRAAKILARNEMPLTEPNLDAVMLVDQKVRMVTENLHPNIVVQMIKDQLSPVDLHIDEVLNYMSSFEQKLGTTPDENFAKAIVELDHDQALTPIERESLVGIYRMFSTVSQSKGSAVGFLMKNDLPLKLDNLFEAAKYLKQTKGDKQKIQTDIDDDFGLLKEVHYDGKNIKQQIETALQKTTMAPTEPHIELAKELIQAGISLEVQTLNKAGLDLHMIEVLQNKATYDKLVDLTREGFFKDKEISVDRLIQQLSDMQSSPSDGGKDVLKSLETLAQVDVETLKTLEKYGLDKNLNTLITAHEVAKQPFELSHQLNRIMKALDEQSVNTAPLKEILNKAGAGHAIRDYEKTLSDIKEQLNIYNQDLLNSQSLDKGPLHKAIVDTNQILEYQTAIHNGDEYYQIPMILHGKMTQINMYYFGENKQSKSEENKDITNIYLYFDTEHLGKVQANIRLEKETMDFSLYSSNPEDLEFIKSFGNKIGDLLNNTDYQVKKVHYGFFEGKSPIQEAIKETIKEKPKKHKDSKFETTI